MIFIDRIGTTIPKRCKYNIFKFLNLALINISIVLNSTHDIKDMFHYVSYLELHRHITQNVKTDPTNIPSAMPTDNEKGWILMTSMK